MELREYLAIFNRAKWVIIVGTIVVVVLTFLVIKLSKTQYDSTMTITVGYQRPVQQGNVGYFLYDDYYSMQSSGLFATTVASWMQSPNIVQAIYAQAGITLPKVRNASQLGKIFTVSQSQQSTTDTVTLRGPDKNQSEKLLSAASQVLEQQTNNLNNNQKNNQFILQITQPSSTKIEPFWSLDISIAIVLGLLVTTFGVMLNWYLTDHKARG